MSENDQSPRAGAVFSGKDLSVYREALRISITGEFLSSLAEEVDWLVPAEGTWAEAPAELRREAAGVEQLFQRATKATHSLDLLSAFLSPYAASRAKRIPTREEVLEHLTAYLKFSESLRRNPACNTSQRIVRSAPHAEKLRDLFRQWIPTLDVPAEVIELVRSLFGGLNIREPPEGWDRFEGFALRQS